MEWYRFLSLAAALVAAMPGNPLQADEVERTETRRDASLHATFEIAMIANPSTGYEWHIDAAASTGLGHLSIEHAGMTGPPCNDGQPLVGARSIESWLVTPSGRGRSRLVFVYSRPGGDDPPLAIYTFNIEVRD